MKKWIIFIIFLFIFSGCSTKTINIPVTLKPNIVQNSSIRKIKVDKIQNDNIGLRENIIYYLQKTNNIIPNYFEINTPNYQSILTGKLVIQYNQKLYTKIVPNSWNQKNNKPKCEYKLYPCKSINGVMFCKKTVSKILTQNNYSKLEKKFYSNGNYISYNNSIYKVNKKCKSTTTKLYCQKNSLNIQAFINIKSKNNEKILEKIYYTYKSQDPCHNIYVYEGKTDYNVIPFSITQKENMIANIAQKIVNDIAPHTSYFISNLYTKSDVDLDDKDKKTFDEIMDNEQNIAININNLKLLHKKYPKSCVISYDLSIYEIFQKHYNKAINLLKKVSSNPKCDEEKDDSYKLLNELNYIY